jgi:hypothetical protein
MSDFYVTFVKTNEEMKTDSKAAALKWWNSMKFVDQFDKCIEYCALLKIGASEKHPHRVTTNEIIEMHKKLK